jgi:hypothetical protein
MVSFTNGVEVYDGYRISSRSTPDQYIDMQPGEIYAGGSERFDWVSRDLLGDWAVDNVATGAANDEIVNWQAMESYMSSGDIGTVASTNNIIYGGDDASGVNGGYYYFAIGGLDSVAQTNNGAWRVGIVNSNLTFQVRVSGAWTNSASFTRP